MLGMLELEEVLLGLNDLDEVAMGPLEVEVAVLELCGDEGSSSADGSWLVAGEVASQGARGVLVKQVEAFEHAVEQIKGGGIGGLLPARRFVLGLEVDQKVSIALLLLEGRTACLEDVESAVATELDSRY
jgi:hypothetical protein